MINVTFLNRHAPPITENAPQLISYWLRVKPRPVMLFRQGVRQTEEAGRSLSAVSVVILYKRLSQRGAQITDWGGF